MKRPVTIVAHTHWDREWYASFEAMQQRLVDAFDQLIPHLGTHFPHFLLDGQMAAIDDYLALRPDQEPVLAELARDGVISLGPWYVLMDEFCVSGETLVRNLQLGLQTAEAFGGAMEVGYLPDMFGHVAQMPQLLCQAGFGHAVVWRGVPSAVNRTAFWWTAPDGSSVRAEYLPVGYANGGHLPAEPDALIGRLRDHEQEVAALLRPGQPLLLMAGNDHRIPAPGLPQAAAVANEAQEQFEFELGALPHYLASAPVDDLPVWEGELRSSARANLLMGVASNRVDVKVAAALAERALERRAEPLGTLWLSSGEWPSTVLERAWLEVIRNAAHDSVCACSSDEVVRAVLARYDTARTLADGVADRALWAAAASMAAAGFVVVNPAARSRSGLVELWWPSADVPDGAQVVSQVDAGDIERHGRGGDLGRILGELTEAGWLGPPGSPVAATLDRSPDGGVRIGLDVDAAGVSVSGGSASVMWDAWAAAGARRDGPLTVAVHRRAASRIAVRACDVPGFGWATWEPGPVPEGTVPEGVVSEAVVLEAVVSEGVVSAGPTSMANGLVSVDVDPLDGTFAIDGIPGFDRLVDSGDDGDTYNYSPPATDVVVDLPEAVTVELLESGPIRGCLRVTRRYRWPARVDDGRRVGDVDVTVVTDIELRVGERLVRVATTFDNPARDHRLRTLFPLPEVTTASEAECAFGPVRRGLAPEGGPGERGLATYPSRRWVAAGGVVVTHEGLLEYEVVDDERAQGSGQALALTLLRSTGILSRPAPAYRPNAAGPSLPVPAAQLLGPRVCRYAVALAGKADAYRLADDAWLPMEVVVAAGGGTRDRQGSLLRVEGAEVSALRRDATGRVELRVFNPTDEPATVRVAGRGGQLVDLRGREIQQWQGQFVVGARAIATARFDG